MYASLPTMALFAKLPSWLQTSELPFPLILYRKLRILITKDKSTVIVRICYLMTNKIQLGDLNIWKITRRICILTFPRRLY